MDTATRRLFVGCRSKVMAVLDADSGKVIATMPIGSGVDAAVFDPATKRIYCSCGDGTVSVFHEDSPDKYSAVETIKTEAGAKTMALDPKTKRIFLSVAERKERTVVPDTFHILVYGQ
jgi:DNA-binding beta-propeller fold protein YncE